MAYEYLAALGADTSIPLAKLFDSSDMRSRVEVVSSAPSEVLLRWLDAPRRVEWPEDIAVVRQPDSLLISFHSGTALARGEFLSCIRTQLVQAAQVFVEFEEL